MSEIHVGGKKTLRKGIHKLNIDGYNHNLKLDMKVTRHNGTTVIVDHDKKEPIA